jgi:hypothetical protein
MRLVLLRRGLGHGPLRRRLGFGGRGTTVRGGLRLCDPPPRRPLPRHEFGAELVEAGQELVVGQAPEDLAGQREVVDSAVRPVIEDRDGPLGRLRVRDGLAHHGAEDLATESVA